MRLVDALEARRDEPLGAADELCRMANVIRLDAADICGSLARPARDGNAVV
jgi:hypothetical protein